MSEQRSTTPKAFWWTAKEHWGFPDYALLVVFGFIWFWIGWWIGVWCHA